MNGSELDRGPDGNVIVHRSPNGETFAKEFDGRGGWRMVPYAPLPSAASVYATRAASRAAAIGQAGLAAATAPERGNSIAAALPDADEVYSRRARQCGVAAGEEPR